MRILELRFKNLNSLQGEWKIDFSDPEYVNNGIFALTGPTGAGKSTILDAICLALYGETPRLGRITKSENEIMSRHTGECYAEVVFQSQAGIYRCQWMQHRARKSANGDLQDPRHEIAEITDLSNFDASKLIESKKSRVVAVIEEKTGMDFKRFNRSILLAQGSFDSFLKADSSHKSEILEQITGTEIYSEISKQVHERKRTEEKKLDILQAEIKGIALLTDAEIAELNQEIMAQKLTHQTFKNALDHNRMAVDWLKNIAQLQKSLDELQQEKARLTEDDNAFAPKKQQWLMANKAAELDGDYANLLAARQQLEKYQQELTKQQVELPLAKSALDKSKKQLDEAILHHKDLKKIHQEQMPIWQKVRTLDYALNEKERAFHKISQQCEGILAEKATHRHQLMSKQMEHTEIQTALNEAKKYLQDHSADEWLVNHFFAIKAQLSQLQSQDLVIEQHKIAAVSVKKKLQEAQVNIESKTAELAKILEEKATKANELAEVKASQAQLLNGRSLPDYRREKDGLLREQSLLNKIASLEAERARLQDGKACPLCGSLVHPYAAGQTPTQDEVDTKLMALTEHITALETHETLCIQSEQQCSAVALQATLKSSELTQLQEKLAELMESQQKNSDGLTDLEKQYEALNREIHSSLQPLNIDPTLAQTVLLDHLNDRLKHWEMAQQKVSDIQQQLVILNGDIQQLSIILTTKKEELALKQTEVNALQTELLQAKKERKSVFGDKKVEEEENRTTERLQAFEREEAAAREHHHQALQTVALIEQTVNQLTVAIKEAQKQVSQLEAAFKGLLQKQSFNNEADFQSARLSSAERAQLDHQAKALAQRSAELQAREKDRTAQLALESAKNITTESLENLSEQLQSNETEWLAQQEKIVQLEFKLTTNAQALAKIAGQKTAMDQQRLECQRWDKLHGLIGSADGKKYRNFAQGLTFELMVNHANRQLEKMTDRYLLMRDKDEPLKLNVIDNYQAGEERSTKNLSGGESFIISLALALGLSKMASQKVRVDSLFLDEGFGTLDEEALDTALAVLSNLHGEGKLIGVISHVSALKERIQTQIRVKPMSGGRSEIIGAGCERLGL